MSPTNSTSGMNSSVCGLKRLEIEHKNILAGIDSRLSELRRYSDDYKSIDQFLLDLPKRLSYRESLVPFGGSKGLVKAHLVDTNEVLVFLGTDHFATMTCYQARQLVSRRSEAIRTQIEASSEERRLIAERLQFSSALTNEQEGGGIVEIREEIDDDEEKRWDDRHRQFLRQRKIEPKTDHADLMKRLETLEMEEEEMEEKILLQEERREEISGILSSPTRRRSTADLHVRFSVDQDAEEDDSECQSIIRFRHSHTPETLLSSTAVTPASIVRTSMDRETGCSTSALGDIVVERTIEQNPQTDDLQVHQRPVSRFRAQRLGKNN